MKIYLKKFYLLFLPIPFVFFNCSARSSSYPFICGDTFRAIANHIIDETNQPFFPENVKSYDIIFLKGDYIPHFFKTVHLQIKNPYILLTHNSDYSPIFFAAYNPQPRGHDFSKYLNDPKLIVWFAQNIDFEHSKLKALPLGIANNYWSHGNVTTFQHAMSSLIPLHKRLSKIYVNFTAASNPPERGSALEFCKKKPYCDIKKRTNHATYLEKIKQYKYVLSPPGNGIDCHRAWEALLMGCIPIMKHSLLDSLFEELPVIFVNNWSEITEDFLNQKYQEIISTHYNYERMYADYWIQLIRSYQNK